MELYMAHGITLWSGATNTEMGHIDEYDTFKDLGKGSLEPVRYKKIRVHIVYDVKHDRYHKSSLMSDGHLTDIPF